MEGLSWKFTVKVLEVSVPFVKLINDSLALNLDLDVLLLFEIRVPNEEDLIVVLVIKLVEEAIDDLLLLHSFAFSVSHREEEMDRHEARNVGLHFINLALNDSCDINPYPL